MGALAGLVWSVWLIPWVEVFGLFICLYSHRLILIAIYPFYLIHHIIDTDYSYHYYSHIPILTFDITVHSIPSANP